MKCGCIGDHHLSCTAQPLTFSDGRVMLPGPHAPAGEWMTSEGCGRTDEMQTMYLPVGMEPTKENTDKHGFSEWLLSSHSRPLTAEPVFMRRRSS